MNRLIKCSLIISLVFFLNKLSSQTFLGLSAGFSVTTPFDNNSSPHLSANFDYNNSFFLSFEYREKHNKSFSLGASMFYLYQNVDYYSWSGGMEGSSSINGKVKYGYLDLCFFPEFSYGNKAQFYFNFGPYFGFLINSAISGTRSWSIYEDTVSHGTNELSGSAQDYLNGILIGGQIGIGARYALSEKTNIHIDFSNRLGSLDLKSEYYSFLTNIILSVGIEFTIDKKNRPKTEAASK